MVYFITITPDKTIVCEYEQYRWKGVQEVMMVSIKPPWIYHPELCTEQGKGEGEVEGMGGI